MSDKDPTRAYTDKFTGVFAAPGTSNTLYIEEPADAAKLARLARAAHCERPVDLFLRWLRAQPEPPP